MSLESCCVICPEMFEGIDVVPAQSFIEVGFATGKKELTYEQFRETAQCCPVCLEQLQPPLDQDDAMTAGYLETDERVSSAIGFLEFMSSPVKLKDEMSCCTACPDDSIPADGLYEETSKSSGSFLEFFSLFKKQKTMDKRIKADGCCNLCDVRLFENPETRYQEADGTHHETTRS